MDSNVPALEPERKLSDAGASRMDSHAGAWEPEKENLVTLARHVWIPTLARGNQKIIAFGIIILLGFPNML